MSDYAAHSHPHVRVVLRVLNEPVAAPPRVVEVVKEKQPLTLVGGVDLSFFRDDKRTAIAALVVCSFPQLEVNAASPPLLMHRAAHIEPQALTQ